MAHWTLLTNHGLVLSHIAKHTRMTALEISSAIGITERATRKIIAELLEEGYIAIKKEGRRNRYRINPEVPLRHPSHDETAVGDLLKALGWKRRGRPPFQHT
jgi:DNA-binding transcriptional ArsR family regulator